ncbi:MAG: hypothetical protein JSW47_16015, partial [Phycisphaerales bacterium]
MTLSFIAGPRDLRPNPCIADLHQRLGRTYNLDTIRQPIICRFAKTAVFVRSVVKNLTRAATDANVSKGLVKREESYLFQLTIITM